MGGERQVAEPKVTLFPCCYRDLETGKEQGLLWGETRQQCRCQKHPSEGGAGGSTWKAVGLPAGQGLFSSLCRMKLPPAHMYFSSSVITGPLSNVQKTMWKL